MVYPFVTAGAENTDYPGFDNKTLQTAVDAVAGGGEVRLSAGTYMMHDSLRLHSGVAVRGQGEKTVLFKAPSVESDTVSYLGVGHFEVNVKNPERFRPGMGIYITDNHAGGFYSTVATVLSVEGNRLGLSRALCSDINGRAGGKAASVFPVIEGYGIADSGVFDLVVDGNRENNCCINGCRGAGIFLLQSDRVTIRGVKVCNFNGEGISFQHGVGCVVENNLCENNAGNGLHPGGGSVAPLLRGNRCLNNDGDGIFYCLRVMYSTCENNICSGNGGSGISVGHRDNHLLIRGNTFEGNRRAGIYYRPDGYIDTGVAVIFENNTVRGNLGEKYGAQVYFGSAAREVCLFGNTIAAQPGQPAVAAGAAPESLYLDKNIISGEIALSGGVYRERPAAPPPAGCEFAKPEHSRHLGRPGKTPF